MATDERQAWDATSIGAVESPNKEQTMLDRVDVNCRLKKKQKGKLIKEDRWQ